MSDLTFCRRGVLAGGLMALFMGGSAAAQVRPVVARFRIEGRRVLIDALLNGKGPFPFILDTGAVVSGVLEKTAKEIGLRKIRDVKLKGDQFPLYAADEMILGGAVRQTDVALAGLWRLGGGVGLLAAGLVTAFDSDLDFDHGEWRVYPQGAGERAGFAAIPSALRDNPGANGSRRIEGKAHYGETVLSLLWDTGAPWPLKVNHAAARRLGLWNDDRPWVPIPVTGITGTEAAPGRLVRAAQPIRIGPLSFDNQLISLGAPSHPASSWGSQEDGLLGLPIIQRMNIAVDSRAGRILVKASGLPDPKPTYGYSGVWLDRAPGGATIGQVGRGSPGEAAGLKAGDRVSGDWPDLLRSLGGPLGGEATLNLVGRGPVVFALADYL
jgi:serine protease Do